ncbi:MAG: D-alanine--D-alanine ligase, partial [Phascolarctobacterium sp.]|nr:D-alanine--D-alanine ligase [Candidatus Phascolarctobacterium equi]
KYTKGATDYHCPAPFDAALTAKIQDLAKKTYVSLGLAGVARVDLMMDEKENVYVLEANTIPGMTATSLVPKMAAAMGISFPDLCEMILESVH